MLLSRRLLAMSVAFFLATVADLSAQTAPKNPHIGYVFPGGGRRGNTFEVTIGGENIKEVSQAFISGGGVKTKVMGWYRPMTQGEYTRLNMKIREKQDELEKNGRKVTREEAIKAAGITEEQLKEMAIYVKRRGDPKRQPNVQIAEELTLQVQLDQNATFGDRELRLLTPTGMSNPMWFYVGQYQEYREREPNDEKPDSSLYITTPCVINGQINPGDVDRFIFEARKGMKLVCHCGARELIPYLADGVPGWFQAVLHLYDEQGTEVAFADAFGFRHDPVLYYEVPKDGKYIIEVHDSIYRGREDFVYRLTLGEIPYITGFFPLGGRAGTPCTVEVKGWNLPVDTLKMEPSFDRGRTIKPIVLSKDNIFTNKMPFIIDSMPEVMEKEPNDSPETAQTVPSSVTINGHIDKPGDVDYFKISGSGAIVAEVYARRLYSPLDSLVRLTDAKGKTIAVNDDYEDKSWPLVTHHADSRLLTVTTSGHYIAISDAQGRGGPDFAYRLYIRPPRPDFDLRVTPSSIIARAGQCVPIAVHAIRKDGFADDIRLELENAPKGYALSGDWLPGGQDKVRLTLYVPPTATTPEPISLQINGRATIGGRTHYRPAFPAENMMQAFAYYHLVPTKDWTLFITGSPAQKPPCMIADAFLHLPTTGTAQVRVMVNKGCNASELRFELSEPPDGISLKDPTIVGPGLLLPIKIDSEKVKSGLKGNLLLVVSQERTVPGKEDKNPTTHKTVIGMLPAVPFEVSSKR